MFLLMVYMIFLSIKVENLNERNKGKAFRIMENFLIARLNFNDQKTLKGKSIINPGYIFEIN